MNKFRHKDFSQVVKLPLREIDEISVVENYPAEMQNINEHGFIRNDISQLMMAQLPTDLDYILNRISLAKKDAKFAGMDDKSILLSIKPRLIQSPAEIDKYLQYLDDTLTEAEKEIISTQQKETETIKFEQNENEEVS